MKCRIIHTPILSLWKLKIGGTVQQPIISLEGVSRGIEFNNILESQAQYTLQEEDAKGKHVQEANLLSWLPAEKKTQFFFPGKLSCRAIVALILFYFILFYLERKQGASMTSVAMTPPLLFGSMILVLPYTSYRAPKRFQK